MPNPLLGATIFHPVFQLLLYLTKELLPLLNCLSIFRISTLRIPFLDILSCPVHTFGHVLEPSFEFTDDLVPAKFFRAGLILGKINQLIGSFCLAIEQGCS